MFKENTTALKPSAYKEIEDKIYKTIIHLNLFMLHIKCINKYRLRWPRCRLHNQPENFFVHFFFPISLLLFFLSYLPNQQRPTHTLIVIYLHKIWNHMGKIYDGKTK